MDVVAPPILDRKRIRTPPPWVLRAYLTIVDRFARRGEDRRWIFVDQLSEMLGMSDGSARQLVLEGTKAHLLVRVYRGAYVLVRPSLGLRLGALPAYWAELLAVNDALDQSAYAEWAFACVTASSRTDYVPDRPWLVTHPDQVRAPDAPWRLFDEVDRFAYAHSPASERIKVSFLEWETEVPLLTPEETALILASTRMPREVDAATQLLDHADVEVDAALARRLNFYNVRAREDVGVWEDPDIRVPEFIEERQERLGRQILRTREG